MSFVQDIEFGNYYIHFSKKLAPFHGIHRTEDDG